MTQALNRDVLIGAIRRSYMLISGLLGVLAVFAMPPFSQLWVLVIVFSLLALLLSVLHGQRAAFYCGWWFGFGYFLFGIHWIAFAFLVEADRFAWLIPFLIPGLCAFYAVYYGLACFVIFNLKRHFGLFGMRYVLLFSILWTFSEMARGYWFSGFPWNVMGVATSDTPALAQSASFWGVWGVGFVLVFIASSLCAWCVDLRLRWQQGLLVVGVATIIGGSLWWWGAERVTPTDNHPSVRLHLVQGDIPQKVKWLPELREQILNRHLQLSLDSSTLSADLGTTKVVDKGGKGRRIVIWPETAINYLIDEDKLHLRLASPLKEGEILIGGGLRREFSAESQQSQTWNSLFAINQAGRVAAFYDKVHLVPFGEYIPSWRYFPLGQVLKGFSNLSAGDERTSIALSPFPAFSPLICYEIIFAGEVSVPKKSAAPRPEWLLNITNDAWFGDSLGPWQHLGAARLRAIEEGIPLVRAANTGISAVVDAYGVIQSMLGSNQRGIIRQPLPKALPKRTFYARYHNITLLLLLTLLLVITLTPWTLKIEKPLKEGRSGKG
ncbi:MAG: apolipoprotein N-acyltransferase [Alphaproteobacteria bacterium GM202ARS2]|nr:apolipoprotein N-acyltransferase [Alphaproteobacteria bacterium GM202ARS2]